MRVLVIGGAGLVGRLTLPLLAEQHQIRVFDRNPPAHDVEFVQGDLRDFEAVREAVRGTDALVFMAMGHKENVDAPENAQSQFDVSVTGLHGALLAAHEQGIRHAVYTSSMSVYALDDERRRHEQPYPDESRPPDAVTPYGLAKRLGEEVCRAAAMRGMSTVALRLCFPIPDDEWPLTDGSSRVRTIATSGRDVARAILAGLDYRGHGFESFGISGDTAGRLVSIEKARRVLRWEPLDPTPEAHS